MFSHNPMSKKTKLKSRCTFAGLSVLLLSFLAAPAFGQESNCGSLQNGYGPYDYRTNKGETLDRVERYHFTPEVEALIKGTSGYLGGDLDYTLRAFPNNHRALMAAMRYGEKTKSSKPPNMNYTVDCYFIRALQFKPDDTTARLLYATFLAKNGRQPEAIQHTNIAETYAKDNPFTHYNVGLVYFDLKQYDKSLAQAHIAEELGFPETGLRQQLQAAGQWKDAPPRAAAAPAAPASDAPAPAAPVAPAAQAASAPVAPASK